MPLIITFVLDVPIGPLTFPVSLPVWEDSILTIGISQTTPLFFSLSYPVQTHHLLSHLSPRTNPPVTPDLQFFVATPPPFSNTPSDPTCIIYRGLDNFVSGKYIPNRFLIATRCLLNLSSGLKRAGWADSVTFPSGLAFCNIDIHVINFSLRKVCFCV